MSSTSKIRRVLVVFIPLIIAGITYLLQPDANQIMSNFQVSNAPVDTKMAVNDLAMLEVKGRSPKTGYARTQFGNGWSTVKGCDTRNRILQRDLEGDVLDNDGCKVLMGVLYDVYTGKTLQFQRGELTSQLVQIDHVVSLSNAWQTGAQRLSLERREEFANDPLNLQAVDGQANQQKSDGDAATWIPSNKSFRCEYATRQIAVKKKYTLWVTESEGRALNIILASCRT
jgi:hypothetical protein